MAQKLEIAHSVQLTKTLDLKRISETLTDVVLVCGGRDFPAHKVILSASSNYFRAMFTSGMKESAQERIDLPTVSAQEMDIILSFFYTGKIKDVAVTALLKFLVKTSHMLEINELFEYSYKKLCKGLRWDCFLDVYDLADEFNDEGMLSLVVDFLAEHFAMVVKSAEFSNLSFSQLQKIIKHSNKYFPFPDETIKELLQWAEINEEREDMLSLMLSTLDLENMSTDFLVELLRTRALVRKNNHILTLLTAEATTRMLEPSSKNLENVNEPKLLCFRTEQKEVFKIYYVKQNRWSLPKIFPFHLEKGASMVWFGGYLYFLGGGNDKKYTRPLADVVRYSPLTNDICSLGKLQMPVRHAGVGVLSKLIYVVNGMNEANQSVFTVQRYNPITGFCESVANTNKSHTQPQVLNYEHYLYVVGSGKTENAVERYSSVNDEWTEITNVPGDIEWCSAAIFTKKLFVVPTYTTGTDEFQVYDFDSTKWTQKKIEGAPKKIKGLYPVTLESKTVLLVYDAEKVVHVYDAESNKWIQKSEPNLNPSNWWQTCAI